MGDIVLNAEKKDVGLSSIHVPMLNASNYTVWAMRMKIALKVNKVWEATETSEINEDKNNLAMALIVQAIPEALFLQVGELDTAKKIWDAIKARHIGADRVKEARLQTLMADFDRLKMKDTEKVDEFGGKLAEISAKSAALGVVIEESKMVKKFLSSLPRGKFIQIVASLEQVLDLNTTSFEDIMGRIKAYEERITEEENIEADQSKLLYSNMETQASQTNQNGEYNENFKGRGRGHSRGRGRGRNNGGRDLSQVECFRCDKYGHYASKCPDRLLKLQEAQEGSVKGTEEADELMMHEVVYLNEEKIIPSKYEANNGENDVWYLDNGASNHMTRDQRYFSKLDGSITGKVRFGDDSKIDIKGKGLIEFIDRNGEVRTMSNVYFIPDLKNNIISLGQATEVGCDVRMKGEWLVMKDQKKKLLVKTKRSKNRLYKVNMGIHDVMNLQLTTKGELESKSKSDDLKERKVLYEKKKLNLAEEELEVTKDMKKLEQEKPRETEANLKKQTKEWLIAQDEVNKLHKETVKRLGEANETMEDFKRVKNLLSDVRFEFVSSREEKKIQLEEVKEMEKKTKEVEEILAESFPASDLTPAEKDDVESLNGEREEFMNKEKEELEYCIENKREDLEILSREREKVFKQEKKLKEERIQSLKKTTEKELEHVQVKVRNLGGKNFKLMGENVEISLKIA